MYVHGWRLKLYASPSISSKKKRIIQIFSCASNVDIRGYPIRFVAAALTLCLPLGSFDAFLSFSIRCRSNQAIATTHDSRWLDIDRTTFGNVFDLYSSLFLSFLPSFFPLRVLSCWTTFLYVSLLRLFPVYSFSLSGMLRGQYHAIYLWRSMALSLWQPQPWCNSIGRNRSIGGVLAMVAAVSAQLVSALPFRPAPLASLLLR